MRIRSAAGSRSAEGFYGRRSGMREEEEEADGGIRGI